MKPKQRVSTSVDDDLIAVDETLAVDIVPL
jgi:hypothetical protein